MYQILNKIRNFLNYKAQRKPHPSSLSACLMRDVILAADLSAKSGEPVDLPLPNQVR